jgi:O-antigen/teichoic acid export membrane protein
MFKLGKIGVTKLNIISNYATQILTSVLGVILIPIYIKYLGSESFGLIGIFATIQAFLTILDLGITPTLSREMAFYSSGVSSEKHIKSLFKTFEFVVLFIVIVITLIIYFSSNLLSIYLVKSKVLSINEVSLVFKIMGLVTALKFFESLYKSALIGLEKQFNLNLTTIIFSLIKSFGSVFILAYISKDLFVFFVWQTIASIINIFVLKLQTRYSFQDNSVKGLIDLNTLRSIWKFAAGMSLSTVLSLILTQFDKIVLIKFLSLSDFGYYYLASTLAYALLMLISPITQAYHPKLTRFYSINDETKLIQTFHEGCQLINIFFGTSCVVIIFYSKELLMIWTRNPQLSENSYLILILLVIGYLFNGLNWMNYHLQQAIGWTSFIVKNNLFAILAYVPAVYIVVPKYGAIGASLIWIFLNLYYITISSHFMFRKIIVTEKTNWFKYDLIYPLITSSTIVLFSKLFIPEINNLFFKLFIIGLVSIFAMLGSYLTSNGIQKPALFKFN